MVEPLTRHLPKAEARARQAAVAEAVTARNYFILRDECGLSPEEAGRAIQWAVKTLIAELQRDQPQ
jgi:hypothetical protein